MANITFFGCLNMAWIHAGCDDSIMTGGTTSENLFPMYEVDHQPGFGRCMADLTGCAGSQVADIFSGGTDSIVAAFTIVADPGMGEILDLPIVRGMAKITRFNSEDVGCRLAGGADAVVAGLTGPANYIGVVEIDQ